MKQQKRLREGVPHESSHNHTTYRETQNRGLSFVIFLSLLLFAFFENEMNFSNGGCGQSSQQAKSSLCVTGRHFQLKAMCHQYYGHVRSALTVLCFQQIP